MNVLIGMFLGILVALVMCGFVFIITVLVEWVTDRWNDSIGLTILFAVLGALAGGVVGALSL